MLVYNIHKEDVSHWYSLIKPVRHCYYYTFHGRLEESALARQVSCRGEMRLLDDDLGFEKQIWPKIFK